MPWLRLGAEHDRLAPEAAAPERRAGEVEGLAVAGQAEHVADPVALAPGHRLGPAVVAVAADQDVDLGPAGADAADHVAQHERHLGPVRGLAGAQDHRHRLARDHLVEVDRQEAAAVVVGVEQREFLATVDAVRGVVDVEHDRASAPRSKLSQNSSTMAAIMRLSAVAVGRFSSRHIVGCEHRSGPLSGAAADRHLEGRVGAQRVAVVGVRVAGRDQQHAEADHLRPRAAHPPRRSRLLDGSAPGARRCRAGARPRPVWLEQNEGAKFWLRVMNELRNRGVEDVLIAVVDGLKGFPEIAAAFPDATVQTCIVRLLRQSLAFVAYKDRKAMAAALKEVYRAADAGAAEAALAAFEEGSWGRRYPAIGPSWRRAWDEVVPFYAFPAEVRRLLYTTNAIEALNSKLRRAVRARGHFPTDEAVMKPLFLVLNRAEKEWRMPAREWAMAKAQFAVLFGERFTKALAG